MVTASPENWVSRLAPDFKVLGTKMQFSKDGFTGHFLTRNCYGKEKVKRILAAYPELESLRNDSHITAYGDSKGDAAMLAFADEKHFRDFIYCGCGLWVVGCGLWVVGTVECKYTI